MSCCPQFDYHQTPARLSWGRRTSTDIFRPGPNSSLVRQLCSRACAFAGNTEGRLPNRAGSRGEQADPTLPDVFPAPSATVPLSSLCPSTSCPDKPLSQSPWVLSQELLSWISPAWEENGECSGLCRDKAHAQMSRGFACSPWPQQQWKCVSEGTASSCFAFPAHRAKAKTKPTQGVSLGQLNPQGQDPPQTCFALFPAPPIPEGSYKALLVSGHPQRNPRYF